MLIFLQSHVQLLLLVASFGLTFAFLGKAMIEYLSHDGVQPIDIHFEKKCRQIALLEAALHQIRLSKVRTQNIPADWQLGAMLYTEFEFEWLLVSVVWAKFGQRYKDYRLEQSPFKWEIQTLENRKPKKS